MIGNSFLDFVKIQIWIGALRSIAPASIAYLIVCAIDSRYLNVPIAVYAAAETTFYLFVYLPRRSRLQAPPTYPPPILSEGQRRSIFKKCLESIKHDCTIGSQFPACWFLPKNSNPTREDVMDWLFWSLFSAMEGAKESEHQQELNEYIELLETALDKKFDNRQSSDTGLVRSMRVNMDPVMMLHRPLLWYSIVGLVDTYTSVVLLSMGFQHYSPKERQWRLTFPFRPVLSLFSRPAPEGAVFPYWHRTHASSTKLPLVFLHGIGIGLYPYIPFLKSIQTDDPDVGILLPELMSICMHMTPRSVPPQPLMLTSFNLVLGSLQKNAASEPRFSSNLRQPLLSHNHGDQLSSHAWDRVVLAGHSYGTFVSSWILRHIVEDVPESAGHLPSLADKIAHIVLVDPISILLSNATVAHNFLYRNPSTVCPRRLGSTPDTDEIETGTAVTTVPSFYSSAAAWQLWYFASRDADIARTLFRTFFWTEGGIWRDEIADFLVGRSGNTHANAASSDISSCKKARNLAVVLGGMDQVGSSEAVRRYLTQEKRPQTRWIGQAQISLGGVDINSSSIPLDLVGEQRRGGKLEVLFDPTLDHAVIFDDIRHTVPLLEVIQRYIRDS